VPVLDQDLFFRKGTTTTRVTLAVEGHLQQLGLHLLSPTPDGFLIESRDERELHITGAVGSLGEYADIPAPLWLGQTAEQQVDLPMLMRGLGVAPLLTNGTFALMEGMNWITHFSTGLPVG
jgi:hypothetical protein